MKQNTPDMLGLWPACGSTDNIAATKAQSLRLAGVQCNSEHGGSGYAPLGASYHAVDYEGPMQRQSRPSRS